MPFSSVDNFINSVSNGKFLRCDFTKVLTPSATLTVGRWHDLYLFDGNPMQSPFHGNYVNNGHFLGGYLPWTLGDANWAWTPATHLITRTAAAGGATLSQNTACVNGTTYSVIFSLVRTAGTVTPSLGGTAGTGRALTGTYREDIICGAGGGAPLAFTPDAAFAGTIDIVGVQQRLAFTPYDDTRETALWHGGNVPVVAPVNTKHLVNMGAVVNLAAGAPNILMLIDLLGVYPCIATNSALLQTMINTLTLPRYTTGAGVRMFYSVGAIPGANAQSISQLIYQSPGPVAGRVLGATVANTASAIVSHLSHSGVAANNFGPFLPLQAGDTGVFDVTSIQLTAASASAGFFDLVLCKPLASIPMTTGLVTAERDLMNQLPSLPRIYDGAHLAFLLFAGGAATNPTSIIGYLDVAYGNGT